MKGFVMGLALAMLAGLAPYECLAKAKAPASGKTVQVYYFHGNYRCHNCINMEAWSRQAVERDFAPELKKGRVAYLSLNVQEKGNEHYINDFALTNKGVVVARLQGGAVKQWKNLDQVWTHLSDREKFMDYVSAGVRAALEAK